LLRAAVGTAVAMMASTASLRHAISDSAEGLPGQNDT
jgi:hypothetical protein